MRQKIFSHILDRLKNKKGVSLIIVALLIILLFAFAALAIDIAYMYFVKNELQVAADAAALAGAALITNPNDLTQSNARAEAISFANKNKAAGTPVALASNNSNVLSSGNDITVGYWDGTTYTAGATPVNAIQVRARRTENSPGGPVSIFLGRIIGLIPGAQAWNVMSASAEAIAERAGPVTLPIPICLPRCGESTDFNNSTCPGKKFISNPPDDELLCGIAGARVTAPLGQTPSADYLKDYFKNPQAINICNQCIRTNQGSLEPSVLNEIQNAFDKFKKIETITHTNPSNPAEDWTAEVTGWRVLVPIIKVESSLCGSGGPKPCPGDQPNPYYVAAMAEVIITNIDTPPPDNCPNCTGKKKVGLTLIGTKTTPTRNVTMIGCLTCGSPDLDALSRVRLVK